MSITCLMDNSGQIADSAVVQNPSMIYSDNLKETPKLSTSTSTYHWRKAVRMTTNALNMQKKNVMPIGKPEIKPFEISMLDPRYR